MSWCNFIKHQEESITPVQASLRPTAPPTPPRNPFSFSPVAMWSANRLTIPSTIPPYPPLHSDPPRPARAHTMVFTAKNEAQGHVTELEEHIFQMSCGQLNKMSKRHVYETRFLSVKARPMPCTMCKMAAGDGQGKHFSPELRDWKCRI